MVHRSPAVHIYRPRPRSCVWGMRRWSAASGYSHESELQPLTERRLSPEELRFSTAMTRLQGRRASFMQLGELWDPYDPVTDWQAYHPNSISGGLQYLSNHISGSD
ncbi:hypothetical protein M3J09_012194 [Ascochyta lentis]